MFSENSECEFIFKVALQLLKEWEWKGIPSERCHLICMKHSSALVTKAIVPLDSAVCQCTAACKVEQASVVAEIRLAKSAQDRSARQSAFVSRCTAQDGELGRPASGAGLGLCQQLFLSRTEIQAHQG